MMMEWAEHCGHFSWAVDLVINHNTSLINCNFFVLCCSFVDSLEASLDCAMGISYCFFPSFLSLHSLGQQVCLHHGGNVAHGGLIVLL